MRIRIHEEVLMTQLHEEAVLLDMRSGKYFGLNEVGTRAYAILVKDGSVDDAFASILKEYDVTPETLRADLDEFVTGLIAAGLALKLDDPPQSAAP